MPVIRPETVKAFDAASGELYENRVLDHLKRFFPQETEALGEARTREEIRYGIARAKAYSIVSERDVCVYIDVMFTLGRDFDTDARYPWASEILNDDERWKPSTKVDLLHKRTIEEIRVAAVK